MAARYRLEKKRASQYPHVKPPDKKSQGPTEVMPANANSSCLTDPSGQLLRNTGAHSFRRFDVLFAPRASPITAPPFPSHIARSPSRIDNQRLREVGAGAMVVPRPEIQRAAKLEAILRSRSTSR